MVLSFFFSTVDVSCFVLVMPPPPPLMWPLRRSHSPNMSSLLFRLELREGIVRDFEVTAKGQYSICLIIHGGKNDM